MSDELIFSYDHLGKFELSKWLTTQIYLEMYGNGNEEDAKFLDEHPKATSFAGYKGEVDYENRKGYIIKYKYLKVPVRKNINNIINPVNLSHLNNPFLTSYRK